MPVQQPNILFLFPDQWRWDWIGCETSPYGKVPVRTPHIDALAARGTRFTQCRSNSPLCAPSRACLTQGVRYENCSVPNNGDSIPVTADTVFRRLRDAGYRTACTGKTDLQKHALPKGLDGWTPAMGQLGFVESANQCGKRNVISHGRQTPGDPYTRALHANGLMQVHLDDYARRSVEKQAGKISTHPTPLPRRFYTDDFSAQQALERLERWPIQSGANLPAPWFMWVNFPGPHEPFDPPRCLQQRYDGVSFPPPIAVSDTTDQDHQQIRRNYAAMCEGIDDWVGRLVAEVEARGELENTMIVFSSDHGEMLGDHGHWLKSRPHEGSVHVPLIVAGPGVEVGAVRNDLVELIDISAMLLEAAGEAVPDHWDARSPLSAGSPAREIQISGLLDWRMIFDGRYKLTTQKVGKDQDAKWQIDRLIDLSEDPEETRDLKNINSDVAGRLERLLNEAVSQ